MLDFEFYSPTKIVFGKSAEERTGEIAKSFGFKKAFVIYGGKSAEKSGLLDRVKKSLEESKIEYKFSGGVVPNPLLSTARKKIEEAKAFKPDFILAIGGGSVIDTAKAVAHGFSNPELDIWDDIWKKRVVLKKTIPVAAIVTISAAGSELSDSSVLTNDFLEDPLKLGINTNLNRPVFAIMNPELTYTLPVYQVAAGAADVLFHTMERYFCKKDRQGNVLSDEFAEGLMRTVVEFGPKAVKDPLDYQAVSEIMCCSSFSHNGITGLGNAGENGRAGDWSCHALGQTLSAIYNSTHGATLTAVFKGWASYVMDADYERFAKLGKKVFGIEDDDVQSAADKTVEKLVEWFKELGMPVSISEILGKEISDEDIEKLAFNCSFGKTRTFGVVKKIDYEAAKKIYTLAK